MARTHPSDVNSATSEGIEQPMMVQTGEWSEMKDGTAAVSIDLSITSATTVTDSRCQIARQTESTVDTTIQVHPTDFELEQEGTEFGSTHAPVSNRAVPLFEVQVQVHDEFRAQIEEKAEAN